MEAAMAAQRPIRTSSENSATVIGSPRVIVKTGQSGSGDGVLEMSVLEVVVVGDGVVLLLVGDGEVLLLVRDGVVLLVGDGVMLLLVGDVVVLDV